MFNLKFVEYDLIFKAKKNRLLFSGKGKKLNNFKAISHACIAEKNYKCQKVFRKHFIFISYT